MNVKLYFYSGNTQTINGENTQFSGIWEADGEVSVEDVYHTLIKVREDFYKKSVVLTSFNLVGEYDE